MGMIRQQYGISTVVSIKKISTKKIFLFLDYTILAILGLSCLLPLIHILAMSFSSSGAVTRGEVGFWPMEFTVQSYKYVLNKKKFCIGTTGFRGFCICRSILLRESSWAA